MTSESPSGFATCSLPDSRRFGSRVEDLNIDLTSGNRPAVSSELITRLSGVSEHEDWGWALPVGVRIVQLLRIVERTTGEDSLSMTSTCPRAACAEAMELTLPLSALIEQGLHALEQGPALEWPLAADRKLALRRVTGRDQQAWQQRRFSKPRDAAHHLLATLVVEGSDHLPSLDAEGLRGLSEAMAEFDPLVAFQLTTRCPACHEEVTLPIDLERVAVAFLHRQKRRLLEAIHRLASAYGWREEEIVQLSPERREFYLERTESCKGQEAP